MRDIFTIGKLKKLTGFSLVMATENLETRAHTETLEIRNEEIRCADCSRPITQENPGIRLSTGEYCHTDVCLGEYFDNREVY